MVRCSWKLAIMLLNSGLQSSPQQRQNKVIHILFTISCSPTALERLLLLYRKWSLYSKLVIPMKAVWFAATTPPTDLVMFSAFWCATHVLEIPSFTLLQDKIFSLAELGAKVEVVYLSVEKVQLITLSSCYFMFKKRCTQCVLIHLLHVLNPMKIDLWPRSMEQLLCVWTIKKKNKITTVVNLPSGSLYLSSPCTLGCQTVQM